MKVEGDEVFGATYLGTGPVLGGHRAEIRRSDHLAYYLARFEGDLPKEIAGAWLRLPAYLFRIEELI